MEGLLFLIKQFPKRLSVDLVKEPVRNIHMSVNSPLGIHPYVSNPDITHSQPDKHLLQSFTGSNLRLTNKTIAAVKVEAGDQPWLTSKRRYSLCSWDSKLRMTPVKARVRTPTWTLVRLAGRDHKSCSWTWLRPSKENSGVTCQSKKKAQKACSINSAVTWEIHEGITVRVCGCAKALYVRQGYLPTPAGFPFGSALLVRFRLKTSWSFKGNSTGLPWSQCGPVNPFSHRQLKESHSPWQLPRLPQEGSCSKSVQWLSMRPQPGKMLEDSAGEPRSYS